MSLFNVIQTHPKDRIALSGDRLVTYGDLLQEVREKEKQLENVDCLAITIDNSVEWILWDLACLKSKTPSIPIPPFFSEAQINHAFISAGVTHVLKQGGLVSTGIKLKTTLSDQVAKITFTSGTTGNPKGVCLSEENMMNVASSLLSMLGDYIPEKHLSVLPLGVLLENVAGVYTSLLAGSNVFIPSLMSLGTGYDALHDLVQKEKIESMIVVPEILKILVEQISEKGKLPSLKFVALGGAKTSVDLIQQARGLGIPVYEGYGLSESASVVSMNTPLMNRMGSVGQILPHLKVIEIKGEIVIQNPCYLGYLGEEPKSNLTTGDLGKIDEQGYLTITGRKKNILITSFGRNVSPEWIESELSRYPIIKQVFVYGDGAPSLSALIVSDQSYDLISKTIERVNETLPDYARILNFEMVCPFTIENQCLTGNGRLRRDQILKNYFSTNKKEKKNGTK